MIQAVYKQFRLGLIKSSFIFFLFLNKPKLNSSFRLIYYASLAQVKKIVHEQTLEH